MKTAVIAILTLSSLAAHMSAAEPQSSAPVQAEAVKDAPTSTSHHAALVKKWSDIDTTLNKGDAKAVLPLIREFVELNAKYDDDEAIYLDFLTAYLILDDSRLRDSRDYALALTCLNQVLAKLPKIASDSEVDLRDYTVDGFETVACDRCVFSALRAQALNGVGKREEAIKVLEKIVSFEGTPDVLKKYLEALKAGKPWPRE